MKVNSDSNNEVPLSFTHTNIFKHLFVKFQEVKCRTVNNYKQISIIPPDVFFKLEPRYYLLTNGCSAVNGCRQNESPNS